MNKKIFALAIGVSAFGLFSCDLFNRNKPVEEVSALDKWTKDTAWLDDYVAQKSYMEFDAQEGYFSNGEKILHLVDTVGAPIRIREQIEEPTAEGRKFKGWLWMDVRGGKMFPDTFEVNRCVFLAMYDTLNVE